MKIAFLGTGVWGYCLASLLASNKHQVTSWSTNPELVAKLQAGEAHPFLPESHPRPGMAFTTTLSQALDGAEMIVESVTSAGFRSVANQVKAIYQPACPYVITSKGIEQNTGEILPEIALDVFGEEFRSKIGILSGPSFAAEVIRGLPTSVVAAAYNPEEMRIIADAFTNASFRVYPNHDVKGVAFGGALKNIIAIACGISEGMGLGNSVKAAIITRGLHEMKKLFMVFGCKPETLYGLSVLGDLCLTCNSPLSRNYSFGMLLGKGEDLEKSKDKIKMVVEGAYTCVSALQLSKKYQIDMPITEAVYKIIYENLKPHDAVIGLMNRVIKEEHL
jgi:glycerol-3-phosphate dehydrogenase (NAD(P)+)